MGRQGRRGCGMDRLCRQMCEINTIAFSRSAQGKTETNKAPKALKAGLNTHIDNNNNNNIVTTAPRQATRTTGLSTGLSRITTSDGTHVLKHLRGHEKRPAGSRRPSNPSSRAILLHVVPNTQVFCCRVSLSPPVWGGMPPSTDPRLPDHPPRTGEACQLSP